MACDVADNTAYPFQGEVPRRGDIVQFQFPNRPLDAKPIRGKVITVEWTILIEGRSRATIHYERVE